MIFTALIIVTFILNLALHGLKALTTNNSGRSEKPVVCSLELHELTVPDSKPGFSNNTRCDRGLAFEFGGSIFEFWCVG